MAFFWAKILKIRRKKIGFKISKIFGKILREIQKKILVRTSLTVETIIARKRNITSSAFPMI